jgi:U3 small nucleolar RNA-associated protein 7
MAGELTLGATHAQILEQRKSLKKQIHSLPQDQKSKVLSHFHGSYRTDLSKQRLKNLREDDKHQDTSNMSDIQRHTLDKRKRRTNPALQRQMSRRETKRLQNAIMAADAEEILHTHTSGLVEVENDMERTIQLTQQQLKNEHLQESVARNIFDLELKQYGPYKLRYDRSGRYSLLAGGAGHVSIIDQHSLALTSEFFVNETVRDACFLHNGSMMAVAQEKNVFVYDDKGVEIHRMDGHRRVMGMEFLPYHWLLGKFFVRVV